MGVSGIHRNKVFIGGSRKVSRLNPEVKNRIDRIIKNRLPVLIGDANGADKAVQHYLRSRNYDQVEVFCVEGSCRNNAGNWPLRAVRSTTEKKDYSFYEAKDIIMADEATAGFMIWDGKSLGTLMNIFRLLSRQKQVVLYAVPMKEFSNLKSMADWEKLLVRLEDGLRRQIEKRSNDNEFSLQNSKQGDLFPINRLPGHTA